MVAEQLVLALVTHSFSWVAVAGHSFTAICLTVIDLVVPDGLEGPPVRFIACSSEDAVDVANDEVVRLTEDENWPLGSVVLLTTYHRHPVQLEIVERRGSDAYWDDFFAEDDVFYGHVLGFKGLERPVVVLAVDGFRDIARAREMLYVGLSRARTLLVVCGDPDLIAEVGGEAVRRRLTSRGRQSGSGLCPWGAQRLH
ncbi:MAG: ATP-binding domain-containing protein [Actinomycetota bacterium]